MTPEEAQAELERLCEEEVRALRAEQHRAEVQPAIDILLDRLARLAEEICRHSDEYHTHEDHAHRMHALEQEAEFFEKHTETLRKLLAFESEDLRENERLIAYCKRLDEAEIAGPRITELLQPHPNNEERKHGSQK
jgi:oligoendopeptidase F